MNKVKVDCVFVLNTLFSTSPYYQKYTESSLVSQIQFKLMRCASTISKHLHLQKNKKIVPYHLVENYSVHALPKTTIKLFFFLRF